MYGPGKGLAISNDLWSAAATLNGKIGVLDQVRGHTRPREVAGAPAPQQLHPVPRHVLPPFPDTSHTFLAFYAYPPRRAQPRPTAATLMTPQLAQRAGGKAPKPHLTPRGSDPLPTLPSLPVPLPLPLFLL